MNERAAGWSASIATALAVLLCGCAKPMPCNGYVCDGCCAADGTCLPGDTAQACGELGVGCMECTPNTSCRLGSCKPPVGYVLARLEVTWTIEGVECALAERHGAERFELIIPTHPTHPTRLELDCATSSSVFFDVVVPDAPGFSLTGVVEGRTQRGELVLTGSAHFWLNGWHGRAQVDLRPAPPPRGLAVLIVVPMSLRHATVCEAVGLRDVSFIDSQSTRQLLVPCSGTPKAYSLPIGFHGLSSQPPAPPASAQFTVVAGQSTDVFIPLQLDVGGAALRWELRDDAGVGASCAEAGIAEVELHPTTPLPGLGRHPCVNPAGTQGVEVDLPEHQQQLYLSARASDGGQYASAPFLLSVRRGQFPSLSGGTVAIPLVGPSP